MKAGTTTEWRVEVLWRTTNEWHAVSDPSDEKRACMRLLDLRISHPNTQYRLVKITTTTTHEVVG